MVVDSSSVEGDEDEVDAEPTEPTEDIEQVQTKALQLALTKQFFYEAFGGKMYEGVLEACQSMTATAQLLMSTTRSFFTPLYPSKSMIVTARNCTRKIKKIKNNYSIELLLTHIIGSIYMPLS
jgi:hypothetical protein